MQGSRRLSLHAIALIALVAVVFANTLGNGYHLDDVARIVENPYLDRVRPISRFFLDPAASASVPILVQYRPLLPLTLAVDRGLARRLDVDPLLVHHVGNVALHAAAVVLTYLLLVELLQHWSGATRQAKRPSDIAFAAAALFAVHPVSGVPVNYLCARDLILMLASFTAFLFAYARMRRLGESPWRWALCLALVSVSLLAKTNAALAPLFVLLFETLLVGKPLRSAATWARPALAAVPVAAFFAWTEMGLRFSDLAQVTVPRTSPLEYPMTQVALQLDHYARNLVWPFLLRPLPMVEPVRSAVDLRFLAGLAFLVALLAAAWHLRRRAPLATFAIASYLAFFLPDSSILPLLQLAVDYRQFPSLPWALLLVALAAWSLAPRRAALAVTAVLGIYFAATSAWLNTTWRDERTLWARSVRLGGDTTAHLNYALAVIEQDAPLGERHLREALRINPMNVRAHLNLGLLLVRRGESDAGLMHLRRAVEIRPEWGFPHYWLSRGLLILGRRDEAALESARAAAIEPENPTFAFQAAYDAHDVGDDAACLRHLDTLAMLPGPLPASPEARDLRIRCERAFR